MKYLIWLLIVFAVVTWIKRLKAGFSNVHRDSRNATRIAEAMQQCARCGMHIPASEAVIDGNGAIFCSEEHRAQHAER
ncbi:MAG TPA: PP0621 family protein [Burkholderiaceae bacterium]|jgi:uncharacterized protein|nr:PP0621 family protein [Burkholderiaceae bacterium]